MNTAFDVFISYNSRDKPKVRKIAAELRNLGLRVWFDEWELRPGQPWQQALEEVVETCETAAVMIGPSGLGPWEEPEIWALLSEFVKRKMPVIPVLLPGAPSSPRLPLFLRVFTWVDLHEGISTAGMDRLNWGITGKRPFTNRLRVD